MKKVPLFLLSLLFALPLAAEDGLWSNAEKFSNGWSALSWFGFFAELEQDWIYHLEHGYQFAVGDSTNNLFLYDDNMTSWLWVSEALYPWIFKFGNNAGWYRYYNFAEVRPGNRWFYRQFDTTDVNEADINETQAAQMVFVPISPGTFLRGSPADEPGRWDDESPQHEVTLTRGFDMQTTEVTNSQFASVLNWALSEGLATATTASVSNATSSAETFLSFVDTDSQLYFNQGQLSVDTGKENYPVMEVTWYGAMAFCYFLSLREGINPAVDINDWSFDTDAPGYRLPTEAEWEYACRAGTVTAFYNGPITQFGSETLDPNLNAAGWYAGNSLNPDNDLSDGLGTYPVGLKDPNPWGLYDMHGNVWEWCSDFFAPYPGRPVTDPEGPGFFTDTRNIRGGSMFDPSESCRSATRYWELPDGNANNIGFRPVRTRIP